MAVNINEVQADHDAYTLRECIRSLDFLLRLPSGRQFVVQNEELLTECREDLNDLLAKIEKARPRKVIEIMEHA